MENKYTNCGFTIIVDHIQNGVIYFRKFKDDFYCGAFRIKEAEFRKQLEAARASEGKE